MKSQLLGLHNFQNYLQLNPPTYKTSKFNNLITKLTTTITDTLTTTLTDTANKIQTNYTNLNNESWYNNNGTWNTLGGGVTSLNKKVKITASDTSGLQFYAGAASASLTEVMRIDNSGNVGVGITTMFIGGAIFFFLLLIFFTRNSKLI